MYRNRRPVLVIIDSHAVLHRAYHAVPELATATGEPTGALFGLASMILHISQELNPQYVVACRDLPGKTHRHTAYEGYKAHRAKPDDALVSQLIKAPEVFLAFGIPVLSAEGFEADDCIGSITHQMRDADIDMIIASGDMDTLQLVNDHVRVFMMSKGISDTILYDSDRVHERYGFGPEHVVDYKALRGDPSDNITGIRGVGDKTATLLIENFGSIEQLYEIADKKPEILIKAGVKPRILELLKNGQKDAYFSKELATIRKDAPIRFELPDNHWDMSSFAQSVHGVCDKFEFKSIKTRFDNLCAKKGGTQMRSSCSHATIEQMPEQSINADILEETKIALWLLRSDYANPTLQMILDYADTADFAVARDKILSDINSTGSLSYVFESIEKPLIPICRQMKQTGILIDKAKLSLLSAQYGGELSEITLQIYACAGHEFNIASPAQLAKVLYDELQLTEKQRKTAGGARTTREEELNKMRGLHPIVDEILKYRELSKLLSSYIDKLPSMADTDGRIHASFLQAGTTTGRMASENPNLQNIPVKSEYGKRIRGAFVAKQGKALVSLDYSQIELRIAAGLSGDRALIEIFNEGGDVHMAVAAKVFGVNTQDVNKEMRRRAKVINFGILYGMGVNALRGNLGADVARSEAQEFLDSYFARFSTLAQYIQNTKQNAAELGYTETLFGRRRYFVGFKSRLPGLRSQAERMATNAPIQGTQADIIKMAMIHVDHVLQTRDWRDKVALLMQVHDELIYEIDEHLALMIGRELQGAMEAIAPTERLCGVPIKVDMRIGKNWGEL